eukprot:COSAG01_NODE_2890_length_6906_cov_23.470545_5_plen_65_part_00
MELYAHCVPKTAENFRALVRRRCLLCLRCRVRLRFVFSPANPPLRSGGSERLRLGGADEHAPLN